MRRTWGDGGMLDAAAQLMHPRCLVWRRHVDRAYTGVGGAQPAPMHPHLGFLQAPTATAVRATATATATMAAYSDGNSPPGAPSAYPRSHQWRRRHRHTAATQCRLVWTCWTLPNRLAGRSQTGLQDAPLEEEGLGPDVQLRGELMVYPCADPLPADDRTLTPSPEGRRWNVALKNPARWCVMDVVVAQTTIHDGHHPTYTSRQEGRSFLSTQVDTSVKSLLSLTQRCAPQCSGELAAGHASRHTAGRRGCWAVAEPHTTRCEMLARRAAFCLEHAAEDRGCRRAQRPRVPPQTPAVDYSTVN